ncbi:hypothetical protein LCGC14_0476900 [marine sediment metagenome]|uniref:Uncharacterized protein n=1 Tax=marine sediment metagenome TaxID=412755 RepID=A0A0F9VJ75_9ZZZZ
MYTKGEWRRFGGMVDGYGIVSSSGEVIIEQQALSGLENEANAHLIAAAPDMYEALYHLTKAKHHQGITFWTKRGEQALSKAESKGG